VCWRLLTNRAVPGLEEAVELLDWYRARWEIELFFLVLKEGCRVERLQLADTRRLQSALALYMVIAWRINCLMRLGRTLPDLPADMLFEADEWRAAFILNKKPIPKAVPPLNTVLRLIAQRGGFLARRHPDAPSAPVRKEVSGKGKTDRLIHSRLNDGRLSSLVSFKPVRTDQAIA
jgi:hypothetical protein